MLRVELGLDKSAGEVARPGWWTLAEAAGSRLHRLLEEPIPLPQKCGPRPVQCVRIWREPALPSPPYWFAWTSPRAQNSSLATHPRRGRRARTNAGQGADDAFRYLCAKRL